MYAHVSVCARTCVGVRTCACRMLDGTQEWLMHSLESYAHSPDLSAAALSYVNANEHARAHAHAPHLLSLATARAHTHTICFLRNATTLSWLTHAHPAALTCTLAGARTRTHQHTCMKRKRGARGFAGGVVLKHLICRNFPFQVEYFHSQRQDPIKETCTVRRANPLSAAQRKSPSTSKGQGKISGKSRGEFPFVLQGESPPILLKGTAASCCTGCDVLEGGKSREKGNPHDVHEGVRHPEGKGTEGGESREAGFGEALNVSEGGQGTGWGGNDIDFVSWRGQLADATRTQEVDYDSNQLIE